MLRFLFHKLPYARVYILGALLLSKLSVIFYQLIQVIINLFLQFRLLFVVKLKHSLLFALIEDDKLPHHHVQNIILKRYQVLLV